MNEQKPLILIVEDDEDLARLNTRLLKRYGYDVLVAYTAAEARSLFSENIPDLLVLDVELPDGNGFTLCEEFRQMTDAPIIFLTGKTEIKDKVDGLSTGGDYYLTKPYIKDEFLAVVKNLLRRVEQVQKKIDEASVITRKSLTLKLYESKAYVNERDAELTPKEFAVLLMLVQNEDKEVTSEQLYKTVWGTTMNNDANAVRLHISRLKKKLGEEDTDDFAIFTEYGKGYTFTTFFRNNN